MIDLTPVAQAIILLIAAIITTFVVPYVKSKTTEEQQSHIASWTKIAVTAAEQIYSGVGRGEEKKRYVLEFLRQKGYSLNLEEIEALIESAVYSLKNGGATNE